jgi:hypothetical protein
MVPAVDLVFVASILSKKMKINLCFCSFPKASLLLLLRLLFFFLKALQLAIWRWVAGHLKTNYKEFLV